MRLDEYPNISAARRRTEETLAKLEALRKFESADTSLIVYGSIGRGEVTSKSDADWTLLVDGPSVPEHFKVAQQIDREFVNLGLTRPGPTATFGELVSSHELVHHIAGTQDTNQNLTRRILLLLESRAITEPLVRERVLRSILDRYIVHDTAVPRRDPPEDVIPHFLLNDVVRYWRTMASDYAAKMWERQGQGWALRNTKLRFSRKLIYIAGLLTCFSFELDPPEDREEIIQDRDSLARRLASHILKSCDRTPLDVVSDSLDRSGDAKTVRELLESYDAFLGILSDENKRATLEQLALEEAIENTVWNEARDASHHFREAIHRFFLEDDETLKNLTLRYAIF